MQYAVAGLEGVKLADKKNCIDQLDTGFIFCYSNFWTMNRFYDFFDNFNAVAKKDLIMNCFVRLINDADLSLIQKFVIFPITFVLLLFGNEYDSTMIKRWGFIMSLVIFAWNLATRLIPPIVIFLNFCAVMAFTVFNETRDPNESWYPSVRSSFSEKEKARVRKRQVDTINLIKAKEKMASSVTEQIYSKNATGMCDVGVYRKHEKYWQLVLNQMDPYLLFIDDRNLGYSSIVRNIMYAGYNIYKKSR